MVVFRLLGREDDGSQEDLDGSMSEGFGANGIYDAGVSKEAQHSKGGLPSWLASSTPNEFIVSISFLYYKL